MAFKMLTSGELPQMQIHELMDKIAPQIMLKGLGRPWQLWAAHAAVFATNYGSFFAFIRRDLMRLLFGRCSDEKDEDKERQAKRKLASLLFVKFLVWQHLAEAIGVRQGPIGGYFGFPNNWKYRLSLGTFKYPLVPFLGKKRNLIDLVVHILWFAFGAAFLKASEYKLKYIRGLMACNVWICCSDLSQFFASTGHAYFSMLLSACFPENQGRLAGIQTGLIIQWFFSGIGKLGPWFTYVNAPFMLQSKILVGQKWLFNLLVKSPTDLSPTFLGKVVAHTAAAVEYVGPLALMVPIKMKALPSSSECSATTAKEDPAHAESTETKSEKALVPMNTKRNRFAKGCIWFGVTGLAAMHAYILSMPAPFDVYSWNMSFGLSCLYLFYYANFGFDHQGAKTMNRGLVAWLLGEIALCWYGQFFPDKVGYYLSIGIGLATGCRHSSM